MLKIKINYRKINELAKTSVNKEVSKKITGYASIDRQWLKHYSTTPDKVKIPPITLYEYFKRNNKNNSRGIVLNYFHHKISCAKFVNKVETLARNFQDMGIKCGDIINVCALSTPEMLECFFALNKLGASVNLIDPRTGMDGLKKYLNNSNTPYLITLDIFAKKLNDILPDTNVQKIICFGLGDSLPLLPRKIMENKVKDKIEPFVIKGQIIKGTDLFKFSKTRVVEPIFEKNRVAAIVYTGGTTGEPKSVQLSNENFIALSAQYAKLDLDMSAHDRFLSIIPPFFPYGICVSTYVPMSLGLETIIIPNFNIDMFTNLVMEYKPNHVTGVPKYWEQLKRLLPKNYNLSFLKSAGSGGEGMNDEFEIEMNKFLAEHHSPSRVMKGYGMTEVSATAVTSTRVCNEIGSTGIPLICTNVSIFKVNTDEEISYLTGEVGEICISGPGTMIGYKDNQEATDELIKIHRDKERWVHTGDCGYIDRDGNLFVKGRYKRVILRRGQSIYPQNIENIILQSQYIDTVAVVKKYHSELSEVPIVCFRPKKEYIDNIDIVIEDIKRLCAQNLPEYSMPYEYIQIDEIPLTAVGKVDFMSIENMINEENSKVLKLNYKKDSK